jgi:hypothetical protein
MQTFVWCKHWRRGDNTSTSEFCSLGFSMGFEPGIIAPSVITITPLCTLVSICISGLPITQFEWNTWSGLSVRMTVGSLQYEKEIDF